MASDEGTRSTAVATAIGDDQATTASVLARDLLTGETVAAYDPWRPLPPASNTKLLTAAIGFETLGPEFRFETTLRATGEREDERLVGDLVLTGSGAPDLSQADLATLAECVRERGIERVSGQVVLDASAFSEESLGPGWTWDDEQFAYGAKSTPIALSRNVVEITVAGSETGFDADVSPASKLVRLDVDVEPCEDEGSIEVYKRRASEVIHVDGRLPPGSSRTEESPVDDPMMHCGHVFRNALSEAGVTVDGWATITAEPVPDGRTLGSVDSAPLSRIVRGMCVSSDNFVAEQVARAVARERRGEGSWDAWSEIVSAFLDARSIPVSRIRDGSGLSRYNLLPAAAVVETLEWGTRRPWAETYRTSLPVAGEEGTVKGRLSELPVTVRAKTGTLTGTRALSGYVETDDVPRIAFSCLLSNLAGEAEARAVDRIDDVVRRIVDLSGLPDS
jgi:serine-type D-Ala-D-Ala carboxypeptidase/endopeptidase (penicillin-binding protein 4)